MVTDHALVNNMLRERYPLSSIQVFADPLLTDVEEQPRSWKERLFSWPWCPWRKTKFVTVPSTTFYKLSLPSGGEAFVMHPEMMARVQQRLSVGADAP